MASPAIITKPAHVLRPLPMRIPPFPPVFLLPTRLHSHTQSRCFHGSQSRRRGSPLARFPSRSLSSNAAIASKNISRQPLTTGTQIKSSSGKSYVVEEVIWQRSRGPLLCCLYRASHEGQRYVLKDILPGDFQYILDLQKLVEGSAHIRTLVDSIPDRHMFVYEFLDLNLQLVRIPAFDSLARKSILRNALVGLADLHDKGIYHTDIKPANIMMNLFHNNDGDLGIGNVQTTDLEDAVLLPAGSGGLIKRLSGNQFWRSPEAWARGRQHTPADIFSFGITAIYIWLNKMVFFSDEANEAEDPSGMILSLHVSHFLDGLDDLNGFIEYHGGEQHPFVQRIRGLLETFDGENKKRTHFSKWSSIDEQFKDLIAKMTYFDPRRRITAREALQHPWFSE